MKEKLTISDIAELAGVAKSTVSRYLNGGSVKKETANRIQTIISKHGYELKVVRSLVLWYLDLIQ